MLLCFSFFLKQTYTCYILAEVISDYTYTTPAPSLVRNHNYCLIKEISLEERLLLEPHKFVYNTLQFNTNWGLALYSDLPQAQWKCLRKAQSLFVQDTQDAPAKEVQTITPFLPPTFLRLFRLAVRNPSLSPRWEAYWEAKNISSVQQ